MKKLLFLLIIGFISCKKNPIPIHESFNKPDFVQVDESQVRKIKPPKPKPNQNAVIYLDFDGQYIDSTAWNYTGPIDAQPSGLDSIARLQVLQVAKDYYKSFNVQVTDQESTYLAANIYKRTRVILTTSYEWYGRSGGVAYVNSFTWGDDTPCFVFTSLLGYSVKKIGDASSHEAAHTLGCNHQSYYDSTCNLIQEYNSHPMSSGLYYIMGYSYNGAAGWGIGPNQFGCTNIQDDAAIITNTLR